MKMIPRVPHSFMHDLSLAASSSFVVLQGDIGIFGFAVLAIFLDRFFRFCDKSLRFFGFGVRCGLRIFRFLASGFRFS